MKIQISVQISMVALSLLSFVGCTQKSNMAGVLSGSGTNGSSSVSGPTQTPIPTPVSTATPTPQPSPTPIGGTASVPNCTKYVSQSGSLNGQTAYTTFQAGIGSLKAGDVLCVGPGTYHEQIILTQSGTASAPIYVRSYNLSSPAVVDGQYSLPTGNNTFSGCTSTTADRVTYPAYSCSNGGVLVEIYANNVIWNSINVVHSLGSGVLLGDGSHTTLGFYGEATCCTNTNIQFLNSAVSHTRGMGIFIFYASNVVLSGNDVFDTNNYAPYDNHTSPNGTFLAWSNGLNVVGVNVTVSNNKFHEQFAEPVQLGNFVLSLPATETSYFNSKAFRSANNVTVTNNIFYDNWAMEGPYIGNVNGGTISNNLIYSSGNSTYFRGGVPQVCLTIDSETGNGANNVNFFNNIMSNCYTLIKLNQFYSSSTYSNLNFYNNTLLNPYPGGDAVENNMTSLTGFSFFNNLIYAPNSNMNSTQYSQSQGSAVNGNFNSVPGMSSGHNIWSSAPSGNIRGSTDIITTNPGLAVPGYVPSASTPASFNVNAIQLLSGSPALGAGVNIPAVTTDYFGTARPTSAPDIGAYQQ